ncbi:MAG: hypothetical protein ACKV2V_26300 [Blastocatellia bacterium]
MQFQTNARRLAWITRAGMLIAMLCLCLPFVASAGDTSDQKVGSVLFFNRYTSNAFNPSVEDTQINITNTNQYSGVSVHLFFIDGRDCSPSDSFIYLTAAQTASFTASYLDPGVSGYIMAVATSGGSPTQFNHLAGNALIKTADGCYADLPAVAVCKLTAGSLGNANSTANIVFDGSQYERLPGVVALSSFNSPVTDKTTMYLYSPSPDMIQANTSGSSVFMLVYNDIEASRSTSANIGCYTAVPLSGLRILNTWAGHVPPGRTGWIRMQSSKPLLGASLSKGSMYTGGRNFTTISTYSSWTVSVPVY